MPESYALADAYFRAGYEVVQIAWADAWEYTYANMTGKTGNIQVAACRPATAFNWVYSNFFPSILGANSHAGMCALGDSAGSAAIAYSLAYYGAGSYLDAVELLSGPVLSDLEQGCEEPAPANINVCPAGQNYCQLGPPVPGGNIPWTLSPTYVGGSQTTVQNWTNETSSCAVSNPTNSQSNMDWLRESIVDQPSVSGGPTPVFTYSSTSVSGWLCRGVQNPNNYNCAANGNNNSNVCPNNSSPQGQIFYQNVSTGTQPFNVYAVDGCQTAEGVGAGNVPGFYPQDFGGGGPIGATVSGLTAITYDVIGNQALQIPARCVGRH